MHIRWAIAEFERERNLRAGAGRVPNGQVRGTRPGRLPPLSPSNGSCRWMGEGRADHAVRFTGGEYQHALIRRELGCLRVSPQLQRITIFLSLSIFAATNTGGFKNTSPDAQSGVPPRVSVWVEDSVPARCVERACTPPVSPKLSRRGPRTFLVHVGRIGTRQSFVQCVLNRESPPVPVTGCVGSAASCLPLQGLPAQAAATSSLPAHRLPRRSVRGLRLRRVPRVEERLIHEHRKPLPDVGRVRQ